MQTYLIGVCSTNKGNTLNKPQDPVIAAVKPNSDDTSSKKEQVEKMFDDISGKYDLLNRSLSLGIDKIWRKKAIQILNREQPSTILDVATGTADVAIALNKLNPEKIVGVDLSEGMLSVGREKLKKRGMTHIELVQGDSENLPFSDNSFDASIVAFGVRNFENVVKGLADIGRVIKPGGRLVVLEFSKPTVFPVKQLFNFYFRYILPGIGKWVSQSSSAYTYLPESVKAFPEDEEFLLLMKEAGYHRLEQKRLSAGICSIYTGIKEA